MSDQQPTVDVPSVVHQLKQQVSHLEKNVLAYGDLMRGTNPIVSWTTRSTDDRPLEIQTDLGAIADSSVLREAMASTHVGGIREGLNELQLLINTLQGVMNPVPQTAAPAPAPAPVPVPLPDPTTVVGVPPVQPQPAASIMPLQPGPMAGPTGPNVMPVPAAPPIPQQVHPLGQGGELLVPPGQPGPVGPVGPGPGHHGG